MKHLQKLTTLLLALGLLLSLSVTGFAATITPENREGPASITVNLPANINGSNTYQIYKVFDATTKGDYISYTLVDGKTTAPAGFSVDTAGNVTYTGTATDNQLTEADIAAIAAYVEDTDLAATVVTGEGDTSFTVDKLPYGYYYITTTTGTVVTVDSTKPTATVNDKNTVPTLTKTVTDYDETGKQAIAQVGTAVEFDVTITVGNGAKGYVFHDQMESSLSYNGDVTVSVGGNPVDGANYDTTLATGDTITITFKDEYLATLAEGTKILIHYTATITSDALTTNPANNTAWLDYGDKNSTTKDSTSVYNAKLTVTKQDGSKAPLKGAGFVVKNSDGAYYKIENNVVSWVERIEDATEHVSDAEGKVAPFTGLANGTYTLVEKTVPDGYNKAADWEFTISEGDVEIANLEQSTTVINNAGSELPSTGGMGTTLFYAIGGILMIFAVVLLVTRKRMNREG